MATNSGAGTPQSGGSDEQVWRELVARLEEPQDGFMDDAGTSSHSAPTSSAATPSAGSVKDTAEEAASGPKGVADFDPLGVWQQHLAPAPPELSAGERGSSLAGASPAGPRDYGSDDGNYVDDGDDGEGFVPPELPSLRSSDPAIMLSWLGAAGGPLFLVFAAIFWRSIPMLLTMGVIMAFLAGTGYLLFRLPTHRDHDGGDGAVV